MKESSVTVIMPALNEEGNIRGALSAAIHAAERNFNDYEIIVVNDGSTDGTLRIAEECRLSNDRIRVFSNAVPRNIGFCYNLAMRQAKMDYCVMVQGDNPFSGETLSSFFSLAGKADFICGYWKNPEERDQLRQVLSSGFTRFLNLILGFKMSYYNGLQLHRTDWLKSISIESVGFGYQAEVLVKALLDGKSYLETPTVYVERPGGGATKVFRLKNVLNVVRTIARLYLIKLKHAGKLEDRELKAS